MIQDGEGMSGGTATAAIWRGAVNRREEITTHRCADKERMCWPTPEGFCPHRFWNHGVRHGDSNRGANGQIGRPRYCKYNGKVTARETWIEHAGDCPPAGQSVVYLLEDASGSIVYVGSTADMPRRLDEHVRDKPTVVSWAAYACLDREQAYEVETRMIERFRPVLNRRLGR